MLKVIPNKAIKKAMEISDVLDEQSRRIFEEKKLAMKQGDEAVLRQIGEGKDILSRLSTIFSYEACSLSYFF